ncbi:MAG: hypothetical protein PUG64_04760 [Bacteroidales bacterium]|nr:hypothetical protein [Bacteroidales bacterium]MDY3912166.1 hypothetical protein [Sodaliphilus sp.]
MKQSTILSLVAIAAIGSHQAATAADNTGTPNHRNKTALRPSSAEAS